MEEQDTKPNKKDLPKNTKRKSTELMKPSQPTKEINKSPKKRKTSIDIEESMSKPAKKKKKRIDKE